VRTAQAGTGFVKYLFSFFFFVVAPCMLIVLRPLFLQLMHTNYYKIVKQLKSFKIIIVAPTRFGLHKPSSGNSQPVLRESYNVDFGYMSLFEVIGIVGYCGCMQPQYPTIPITSNNDM